MKKVYLSWDNVEELAGDLVIRLIKDFPDRRMLMVHPIPRGGIPCALALKTEAIKHGVHVVLIEEPREDIDIYIDDIIDTGVTKRKFQNILKRPFHALFPPVAKNDNWIVFPWEAMVKEDGPQDNIVRIIEYIGDDPTREGLVDTPDRVVRSFKELYGGYDVKASEIFKTFDEDSCDEMVVLKDIEFYSTCEHHMLPFFGKAHIAYIPNGRVVGISKLARLLESKARRLQIQERICQEITGDIDNIINPHGSACVLEAQHFCMTSRGVQKQNSIMVTSSLTGVFRTKKEVRAEFLGLINRM